MDITLSLCQQFAIENAFLMGKSAISMAMASIAMLNYQL